ncbi:MAG: extracellular solute-binding protein [Oscillospiraceae bacterium]|nr:extracellular solute-binding protein [Oscillospiraceae bacterium]
MKSKQILAIMLLLAASLALFAASACNSAPEKTEEATAEKAADGAEESEEGEQAAERVYPNLEPKDFGGYEFVFLIRGVESLGADWVEWAHRDIFAEEVNGDVINDAVYNRNSKIEEKYNITIKEISVDNPQVETKVTQAVKAGDDIYDVAVPHLTQFPATAQAGNYVDFFSVPYLELEKPWWDQGTIRDLSIIHKLFILQGALLVLDNDAMEAMIFNKELLKEHALDDPYAIVKNGDWTFDKLLEMSKGIAKDLNGDGEMYIKDDLFGCITQADANVSFFVSGGEKICAKDENDYPIVTFGTERGYRVTDKISELMLDENNVVHLHRYEGKFPIYDEQVKMMEENRALFSWIRMRIVERLRGMEMDFGILPLPKLEKAQEKYITNMNPHTGAGISIPVVASDLERTGMILEDLCAESLYTLQPAYYDINLKGKYARDEDSQEMLDIILNNTAHDIGYVYNFGGFGMDIMLRNAQNKKADYASPFEKALPKMESAIDKVVEAYEKID